MMEHAETVNTWTDLYRNTLMRSGPDTPELRKQEAGLLKVAASMGRLEEIDNETVREIHDMAVFYANKNDRVWLACIYSMLHAVENYCKIKSGSIKLRETDGKARI